MEWKKTSAGETGRTKKTGPQKSALEMLYERRSRAELEELLEERLAQLRVKPVTASQYLGLKR